MQNMQAQMTKKEKTPVVFCPRCHAQNLATQKQCGKCGYVFPAKGSFKGEKRPAMPGTLPAANAPGPMAPAAPNQMFSGQSSAPAAQEENGEEAPKIERPKAIPQSGKTGVQPSGGSTRSR